MSDFEYTPLEEQFQQERESGRREGYRAAPTVRPRETPSRTIHISDQSRSRKTVLVAAALMAVIAVYREKQGTTGGGSLYKRLWGIGVVFSILAVVADFAPAIAGPFAVLMLLGSLTNGGDRAIQNLLGSVSTRVPTARQPVVRVGPSGPSQTRLGPGPGMTPPGAAGSALNPAG